MKKFNYYVNKILSEDTLPNGLGDDMSIESLAKKHGVSEDFIKRQVEMGIKVEYEHTNDEEISRNIVFDHLAEIGDYYTRLAKMEKDAGVQHEMVSSGVVGGSGYEGGIAPQDNIAYAKGDARMPKSLFNAKNKKKKKTIQVQRRPRIGM